MAIYLRRQLKERRCFNSGNTIVESKNGRYIKIEINLPYECMDYPQDMSDIE